MLSVFEILNLRTEWEELARGFIGIKKDGTIDSLQEFVKNGHRKNRFRAGFNEAIDIAERILKAV